MTEQDLILMRVQYSEPMTTDEENARRDIETLAGEIERLRAQLAAAQAKIDAVPVGPIRRWYENSNPQLMEYEFIADVETDAEFIEAWLETQVTP